MDNVAIREKVTDWVKKYRYVALVLLAGLFLMALPEESEATPAEVDVHQEQVPDLQEQLGAILSQVQGAGKVQVLLTRATGEETVYQTDRDLGSDDQRLDTVVVTGSDRSQTGLVRQVNPPEYLGAVVLCQGADNASVKLSIVEAVATATGLSTDRISVLKMK